MSETSLNGTVIIIIHFWIDFIDAIVKAAYVFQIKQKI